MEVRKSVLVEDGVRTCGMAELNVGKFLSGFNDVRTVTETVGKNGFATCVGKFGGFLVGFFAFGDVGSDYVFALFKSLFFASDLECVDKVFVISGIFVVQRDKSDNGFCGIAAHKRTESNGQAKHCYENDWQ